MNDLPDFLRLPDDAIQKEKARQESLQRDFHSRARQTGPELEAAMAAIIETDLRAALEGTNDKELKNRLADALGMQGKFIDAAATATGDLKKHYQKCVKAVYDAKPCKCEPRIVHTQGRRIQVPKYYTIRECYSLKEGVYGFIAACSICERWHFTTTSPVPQELTVFEPGTASDLDRLSV